MKCYRGPVQVPRREALEDAVEEVQEWRGHDGEGQGTKQDEAEHVQL